MIGLEFAALAAAGGVGAGLRFVLDGAVIGAVSGAATRGRRDGFPVGILIVNVLGSLLLGVVVGLGTAIVPGALAAILGTGLLGGFTTFSTVSVETVLLAERGRRCAAAANLIGTLALALAAAGLGMLLGGLAR